MTPATFFILHASFVSLTDGHLRVESSGRAAAGNSAGEREREIEIDDFLSPKALAKQRSMIAISSRKDEIK